jgi:hypothetical protein
MDEPIPERWPPPTILRSPSSLASSLDRGGGELHRPAPLGNTTAGLIHKQRSASLITCKLANALEKGQVAAVSSRLVRAVLVAISVGLTLGACAGPTARTAPFRQRPDVVTAGDLHGPFSGRVVDAATSSPITGALVYATWSFSRGYGLPTPGGVREHVVSTDASGNYRIPSLGGAPDGARLTDFRLVVYKRGYVAYRSDRRFEDMGLRLDFAQLENQVRLERWRAELSHASHVRYVGGGPAITALTSWELSDAADELSGEGVGAGGIGVDILPGRGPGAYVVAAQLLSEADIKAATKYDGGFETGPLGDEPDTATYSSQHFKALGRAETYDLALRLWRLPPGEAVDRYTQLLDSLPGVQARDEIANQSLRASEGDIHGIAFLDAQRGVVALLTCGKSQCASADVAATLGRKIYERIQELWPMNLGETPALPGGN